MYSSHLVVVPRTNSLFSEPQLPHVYIGDDNIIYLTEFL